MSTLDNIRNNCDCIEDSKMDEVLDWCFEAEDEGSHYPGMTYEQGIRAVIDWLEGNTDTPPNEG